jgi:predicted DNA-binding transcriptional regulator AlpA
MEPLWTEEQCAQHRGCSKSSLQKERVRGDGPPFVKIGRMVRYRPEDVREWIARQIVGSTSAARQGS